MQSEETFVKRNYPDSFDFECQICGSLVWGKETHLQWHDDLSLRLQKRRFYDT